MDSTEKKKKAARERQRRKRDRDKQGDNRKLPRGQRYEEPLDSDVGSSADALDSDTSNSNVEDDELLLREITSNFPDSDGSGSRPNTPPREDLQASASSQPLHSSAVHSPANNSDSPASQELHSSPIQSPVPSLPTSNNGNNNNNNSNDDMSAADSEPDPSEPGDVVVNNQYPIDAEWLANALVRVKTMSEVSDNAIQKICDVFLPHLEEIKTLLDRGQISRSYRHGIRPKATVHCPEIWYSVKIRHTRRNGFTEIFWKDRLRTIPSKYVGAEGNGYELLCQTAYTTLEEIKEHFSKLHPEITGNSLQTAYYNSQLGIDGVRESHSGPRTLLVISLMFAGCINCWKIYNPLMSVADAKPTLDEFLR